MSRVDDENKTRFWFERQTPGLSLLCADFTTHEYPAHVHDALMIAVTEAGGSEITASGVADEAHSAALLVVNPAASQPGYPVGEDRDPLRPGLLRRTDRRRGSPGPPEPLPAAPPAGRPGAGQAGSPRRKGTGRGLTDPSTTTTPRSVNPAGRGHTHGPGITRPLSARPRRHGSPRRAR